MNQKIDITYIEFKKQEIPVSKMIDIDGRLYSLEIQYNEVHDFYVAILYDDNEKPIISSKLVYRCNAFHACCENMPEKKLIPLTVNDLSGVQSETELRLSAETFEDSIKIYLI